MTIGDAHWQTFRLRKEKRTQKKQYKNNIKHPKCHRKLEKFISKHNSIEKKNNKNASIEWNINHKWQPKATIYSVSIVCAPFPLSCIFTCVSRNTPTKEKKEQTAWIASNRPSIKLSNWNLLRLWSEKLIFNSKCFNYLWNDWCVGAF